MAKKFYAVKKGLTPGIYLTWPDCKKNIDGIAGAVYKGFDTIEEAAEFLGVGSGKNAASGGAGRGEKLPFGDDPDGSADTEAAAYVDGSYNEETREYACGVVLFHKEDTRYFSRKFSDPERAAMRNVAGEMEGSMCAMSYCLKNGIASLTIYYDYEGIEKWCTGAWKANKEGTIAYRDFYRKACESLRIRFVKVKGHSGDKYNDLADRLARQAVGLACR